MESKRPALFLDRDGILNEVVMRGSVVGSPRSTEELRPIQNAREIIEEAKRLGFLTIVVTNQPEIEKGQLSRENLSAINNQLKLEFQLDEIVVCESADNSNPYRKPNPMMILEAAEKFGIDLTKSFLIGDRDKDIEAGKRAGVRTILLKTTYNQAAWKLPDHLCESFSQIKSIIEG